MPGRNVASFPSEDWVRSLKDEVNRSEAYRKAAQKWEGSFIFVVEADDILPRTAMIYVDLWHGTCRDARLLSSIDEVKADFVWSGRYADWKSLLTGDMHPSLMVVSGKFKIKGNVNRLLSVSSPEAADELVAAARRVSTIFP